MEPRSLEQGIQKHLDGERQKHELTHHSAIGSRQDALRVRESLDSTIKFGFAILICYDNSNGCLVIKHTKEMIRRIKNDFQLQDTQQDAP